MIKVFVMDSPVGQHGLASILEAYPEFQFLGNADKITDALSRIAELEPDIVILDVFRSGGGGVKAIELLKQKFPQVKVVVLTDSEDEDDFLKAIRAGANGYLLKSLEPAELIDSIRVVAGGSAIIYGAMAAKLFDEPRRSNKESRNGSNGLSQREEEVLCLVAQGSSTKEIASHCGISSTTVKAHVRSILEKLQAKNRAQAVALMAEKGLLKRSQI